MAINRWVNATLNPNAGASPRVNSVSGSADGLNATLAWDSAIVLTNDQMRALVTSMLAVASGQLTGP